MTYVRFPGKTFLGLVPAVAVCGCMSASNQLAENTMMYMGGKFDEAHTKMATLLTKTSHESYPLYQLTDATILYSLGDLYAGVALMQSAGANMEVELGTTTTVGDLIGSESNVHYRGYVHERVLARYYVGVGYFRRCDFDSARIAFLQALERDINKEAGKENTFTCVHFMLGETCLRLKDYDNAVVAFRNVTRLAPDLPAGWYKLAFALSKTGQQQEAEAAYATYRGACGAEALLPMDGSGSYIFLSLEIGWGPILASDPLLGEFASYSRSYYREHYASVSVADRQVTGRKAEDVYQQAKDEANLAGDVAKKVASIAVKKAVSYIPYIGGLLAGSTAADVRKWLVLPGEIHFALVPVAPGIHDVTLRFYDEEKKELPDFQQTLYYLPAGPEGQAPLVCARSLYQIQNQRQK